MRGLLGSRWGRRLCFLPIHPYAFDLNDAGLRNHVLHAPLVREQVIGSLELGFAEGEDLVAVAKFQKILVRAAAEDGLTHHEYQNQFKLHPGRAHFRHEPTLLRRECQDRLLKRSYEQGLGEAKEGEA